MCMRLASCCTSSSPASALLWRTRPMRTATKRLKEPPPSPRVHVPDIDPRWEAAILRCLAREPPIASRTVTRGCRGIGRPERRACPRSAEPRATSAALAGRGRIDRRPCRHGRGRLRVVRRGTDTGITSIAVLPFETTSTEPEQDTCPTASAKRSSAASRAARDQGGREQLIVAVQGPETRPA